jgi:hypothetical protein
MRILQEEEEEEGKKKRQYTSKSFTWIYIAYISAYTSL